MIILRTVEELNVRGKLRVDKYFSKLIAIKLLIVITGNTKLKYRTILHGQPLWKTSNNI